MHWATRNLSCLALLVAGYAFGVFQIGQPGILQAQPQGEELPPAVRDRLREADRALAEAMQVLQEAKRYVPAIQGLNAFATSVGGVDAIGDLESGGGVDPETFAGLYAGQAVPEVTANLGRDAQGRLTYKNRVVRMYNTARLKQLFTSRGNLAPTGGAAGSKPAGEAKKPAAAAPEKEE
jgi:hypothetical protein